MRFRLIVGTLMAAAGLLAGSAPADLLVTRDGETIETRGEWELEGRVILFTGLDGQLRSLRVVDLDLEESERRTRAAAEARRQRESEQTAAPAAPVRAPAKKAVLVLTDADVRHVRTSSAGAGSAPTQDAEGERAVDRDRDGRAVLRVTDWRENLGADGMEISGTLQNESEGMVAGISLAVDLLADDGSVVESAAARVDRRSLAAGESSGFRASFRTFFLARDPDFRPRGSLLASARPEPDDSAESATGQP